MAKVRDGVGRSWGKQWELWLNSVAPLCRRFYGFLYILYAADKFCRDVINVKNQQ